MNNLSRHLSIFLKRQRLKLISRTNHDIGIIENYQRSRKVHNSKCISAQLTCLKSRGIVQLQGADTSDFLQGLVTNDIDKLMENDHPIQYSFMLNVQGRILYDLFIYNLTATKNESPNTLFIDVPASATTEFITVLKRYKLRKKVNISDVSDEFQVWSQFPLTTEESIDFSLEGNPSDTLISCPDPRVAEFGKRLIRRVPDGGDHTESVDESVYRESRYQWGLPEGVTDLPPGNCFPLESNAIFMNGVNFEKGCYIGQELTARTHYTGVTRKRLMPLVFQSSPPEIESDAVIKNEKGRNTGKFRGSQGNFGLGLVRLAYIKENLSLIAKNESQVSVTTYLPKWWPQHEL